MQSTNRIECINDAFLFECPHCSDLIQVQKDQVNCRIFRHAVYKSSFEQINPHTNKQECDRLLQGDFVYGCAKPFILDTNSMTVSGCNYI